MGFVSHRVDVSSGRGFNDEPAGGRRVPAEGRMEE